MKSEIALVRSGLNGNSVNIYGSDLRRMSDTASAAIEDGLHVWLDPRLPDRGQAEVLEYIGEVARLAESFRKQGADIDLAVGAVHSIFTPGVFPGEPYLERIANIYFDGDQRFGVRTPKTLDESLTPKVQAMLTESAPRLNEFLGRAAAVARQNFHGNLGYSAAPWEQVDWTPFDLIGLVYYLMPAYMTREQHLAWLGEYDKWDKPVFITGFGTASYAGAEEKGFFNWDIVDRGTENLTILDGYVRDEGAQAAYYAKMLGIFGEAGIFGAAAADLVHPTHPHSDAPRHDLDMASMCIVKSIRENFDDPDSPYRRELKESFRAIASSYADMTAREDAVS
jgi:hypothetical protein